jgi:hypothetical protein
MSEKMTKIEDIVQLGFGICGRLLDVSKRNTSIIFNANILVGRKKVWFGDFWKHETYKLDLLAKILGEPVYLLREMDCRFETECDPNLKNAVYHAGAK